MVYTVLTGNRNTCFSGYCLSLFCQYKRLYKSAWKWKTGARVADRQKRKSSGPNYEARQGGHPGIDFQWHDGDGVKIYSSIDSEVIGIFTDDNGRYDLATKNGGWGVDYTELESVNPQLKIGSKLKVGDWVGIPNHPKDSEGFPKYRMIHWQFGYSDYIIPSKVQKRLCPLTYFSPSDRILLEKIWTDTDWPEMKTNAPEICSNYFKGRDEWLFIQDY